MAAKSDRELIFDRRKALENPYAFIEQLAPRRSKALLVDAPSDRVTASRRLLENPYAHLNGNGERFGFAQIEKARESFRWTDLQIKKKVRQLHLRLWRERDNLWGESMLKDPLTLLDPVEALRILGYDFDLEESLGQMHSPSGPVEVAGVIDTCSKAVRVGRRFSNSVRTFTTAHELGHAILHPSMGALHRDRPLDGSPLITDCIEVEANKFAVLFLMPEKLVRARFKAMFLLEQFKPTENTVFALGGMSLSKFQRAYGTSRQLARLLAAAERYNGSHFIPLHQQFRVSCEAMAIRLEELALVVY